MRKPLRCRLKLHKHSIITQVVNKTFRKWHSRSRHIDVEGYEVTTRCQWCNDAQKTYKQTLTDAEYVAFKYSKLLNDPNTGYIIIAPSNLQSDEATRQNSTKRLYE